MVSVSWHIKNQIRLRRRNRVFSGLARLSRTYLKAFENDGNFNFERNGERDALTKISRWFGGAQATVWDVGAHRGEWASLCHGILPASKIFSFEIVPNIFQDIPQAHWLEARNVGLSDKEAEVEVTVAHGWDTANAIHPRTEHFFFDHGERVSCRVVPGDQLVEEGLPPPDILKIDTEGHEVPVLRGLKNTLMSAPPKVIQLEYGQTYLPGGFTLRDVFELLTPCGYSVGRLYPNHVEFRGYGYDLDDFRMGNFIAVRDEGLRKLLSD